MLSQTSPAYFEYAQKVAGRRTVNVGPAVQLNAAHILVAYPDVHMGRFESVVPGVDHEAELPIHRYGWHPILRAGVVGAAGTDTRVYP